MQISKSIIILIVITFLFTTTGFIFNNDFIKTFSEPYFVNMWGAEGNHLFLPFDVTTSTDGTFVFISNGDRVTILNRLDRTFFVLENNQDTFGIISNPRGLTVDKDNNFYVVDGYQTGLNVRILKFDKDGNFELSWGEYGENPGQFRQPSGIAVNTNNIIFVTDGANGRIQKFSLDGTYLGEWSLGEPTNIAAAPTGEVYVIDRHSCLVRKFSEDGVILKQWGGCAYDLIGYFRQPTGITVDSKGDVYVADTGNHRIQKFDSQGNFIKTWGTMGEGNGEFNLPGGIHIDNQDNVYVSDSYNYRIQKFTKDGSFLTKYGFDGLEGDFYIPGGITIDNNQRLFVSDTYNHRMIEYTNFGSFVHQWGSFGSDYNQFAYTGGSAVDSLGFVYVVDTNNGKIKKFNAKGEFVFEWGESGIEDGEFNYPYGITIDNQDYIYVADNSGRIQKFTNNGLFILTWGSSGSLDGQFWGCHHITSDKKGFIFAADSGNHRIQKFTNEGVLVTKWGVQGNEPGQFEYPEGIAYDGLGHIYVADTGNSRIQKFSEDGQYLGEWGSLGNKIGEFNRPQAIAANNQGDIYVMDTLNSRVQQFSIYPKSIDSFSGLISNGSFEQIPNASNWTYGGHLPVLNSNNALNGLVSFRLGNPVSQIEQGQSSAWIYQTIYVNPDYQTPVLTFNYNIFTNDIIYYSDFFVEIQDGSGLNHLDTILVDGYKPGALNLAPTEGTNLGWKGASFNLSKYKGKFIRVYFHNRNLWPNSWGIWTDIDNIRVLDYPNNVFLPLLTK